MWLSQNILSKMIDLSDISPEEIAFQLTMSTAEIERIERLNEHFHTIISAKILEVKPHPQADKLTLVDCDTGTEKVQVICGATNHRKGDIVALAQPGTKFSDDFTVKKTKIRGVMSDGMLCSEREIGLSDDHSGILILPENTALGQSLNLLYPDWIDTRFEIDNKSITHRPDLWSHAGFARELSAIFKRPYRDPVNYGVEKDFQNSAELIVTILTPNAPRYSGLWVKNITIEESPGWLKAAVTSIGMRPINNIVDITNYVMVELGEPMHAFDRNKLSENEIIVRMAENGEVLRTLDGETRTLCNDDIVIADRRSAVALAGVMGGEDSEIDENTTEIVLEAANFNPVSIRKTANRYTLRTEAAIRFEKSLDPELCHAAIFRCYELISQIIPGAKAATGLVDTYPSKQKRNIITMNTDLIRGKLGTVIDNGEIEDILHSLSFAVEKNEDTWIIEAPTYRSTRDITIPDDIVEEVGRIHGYDKIQPGPPLVPCEPPRLNTFRLFERKIKEILVRDHHLTEVRNYSFVGEVLLDQLGVNEDRELRLHNPLSQEQDRLRRSLIPNILKNVEFNQRYQEYFRIFELGRIYLKEDRKSDILASEETCITGAIFMRKPDSPLFYDGKYIAADLLQQLDIRAVQFITDIEMLPPYVHPGRCIQINVDNRKAGLVFEVHPSTKEVLDIKGDVVIFDLNASTLYDTEREDNLFVDLQKFPDVPFEISILTDVFEYGERICQIIENSSREFIRSVDVISVYTGSPIPEGKKSISIKIIFNGKKRTLLPEDVDRLQKNVIAVLEKSGYTLR